MRKFSCPVCQSNSTKTFLKRECVPVHQHLVISKKDAATQAARGNLYLRVCQECGFIFNRAFEQTKLSYGENYDNRQTCSPSFSNYLNTLIEHLVYEKNVRHCRIVEVGCGEGLFLRKLVEVEEWGNLGYGFDPSYIGLGKELDNRLQFEKRYYGSDCTDVPADVVICRHVIEHVPDPLNLLLSVNQALIQSPQAKVFFETPCVKWSLKNQVIWDFFYEHCSYFTKQSLTTAFEIAGFQVISVEYIFNEQYLWLEAARSEKNLKITKDPNNIVELTEQFSNSEQKLKKNWSKRIQQLLKKGKIAVWGAGAKGVTFVNLVDPDQSQIDCVIDVNPNKQGNYVPGTGHDIVDYQEAVKRGVKIAILMNPNYRQENLELLASESLNLELIE